LQVAAQGAFVPHDEVVEALPPDGADNPFHERVLPG
jgi:predicted transcriptional regulator